MPFAQRLAVQIEAFNQAQSVKAWSLVTGLIAVFYAVGITSLAGPAFTQLPDFESVVAVLWAGGAIFGAGALTALGIIDNPSAWQWRIARIGLWAGNLIVCATTLAIPIVFPLALVPVIGGFVALSQRSAVAGKFYLALPFVAFGAVVLNWALGSPIIADFID